MHTLPGTACTNKVLLNLAERFGVDLAEAVYMPARPETKMPVPARLRISPFRHVIAKDVRFEGGIRGHHHQANALIEQKKNVVVTTGTGSGKSLIYMTEAVQRILTEPDARVLAIYPQRALNADQKRKWLDMTRAAGLPDEKVAMLDGSTPLNLRSFMLGQSRIAIMTPDTLHAWLLGTIGKKEPEMIKFIQNIRLKILDEAHLYTGAFGTAMMYLMRRLEMNQRWYTEDYKDERHNQYIAASATIDNAAKFMRQLTGKTFEEVDESHNTSGQHDRLIAKIWAQEFYDWRKSRVHVALDEISGAKKTIIFTDSRRRVEEWAHILGDRYQPYKSGLAADFQRSVIGGIEGGTLDGVVSTSAAEVGVDMAFDVMLNDGLPGNVASALQRIGRVGRHGPGLALLMDSSGLLQQYGSLKNYLEQPQPPQTLYPDNEQLQVREALFLLNERNRAIESGLALGPDFSFKGVKWPKGFDVAIETAKQDKKNWPWHYRSLIPPKGASLHRYIGMRNIGGPSWKLSTRDPLTYEFREALGHVSTMQAFEQYYPGAVVRHGKKLMRIYGWTSDKWGNPVIDMRPHTGDTTTRCKILDYAVANAEGDNLLGQSYWQQEGMHAPFYFAECRVRVTRGINGFLETYKNDDGAFRARKVFYRDDDELLERNPEAFNDSLFDYGPRRRMIMDTSGFVMRMRRPIERTIKGLLCQMMLEEYADLRRINVADLAFIKDRCVLKAHDGVEHSRNLLMIYDRIPGSMRLTRHFPQDIQKVFLRMILKQQAKLEKLKEERVDSPEDTQLYNAILSLAEDVLKTSPVYISSIYKDNDAKEAPTMRTEAVLPEGFIKIMAPGSRADFVRAGLAQRVRIVAPHMIEGTLAYEVLAFDRRQFFRRVYGYKVNMDKVSELSDAQVKAAESGVATRLIIAADLMLNTGRMVGYNPETGIYCEIDGAAHVTDISDIIEQSQDAMRKRANPKNNTDILPPLELDPQAPDVAADKAAARTRRRAAAGMPYFAKRTP